jgi:hypothetical protein
VDSQGRQVGLFYAYSTTAFKLAVLMLQLCLVWRAPLGLMVCIMQSLNWLAYLLLLLLLPVLLKPCQHSIDQSIAILQDTERYIYRGTMSWLQTVLTTIGSGQQQLNSNLHQTARRHWSSKPLFASLLALYHTYCSAQPPVCVLCGSTTSLVPQDRCSTSSAASEVTRSLDGEDTVSRCLVSGRFEVG